MLFPYIRKRVKGVCKNHREISMFCIPEKAFGRVAIENPRGDRMETVREEQWGFRRGRGCGSGVCSEAVDEEILLKE